MSLPSSTTIEAGSAILFLGAGFSAEATNINGEDVKDVGGLIAYLLSEVGVSSTDGYDLDAAAQEYEDVHKEEKTARALHSNFRVKSATSDQQNIVCQPWYRIYTSNYDDAVEKICSDNLKPITTKDVDEDVDPPMPGVTQLIHIYGNITKASASEFKKNFLLTERQRDNSPFMTSPWMRRFHDDILAASAVVFVGFSMTDIDLRRLLGTLPGEVLQKVHFVARSTTKRPIISRMARFGQVHPIGLASFATHLGGKRAGQPVRQYTSLPVSLHELNFQQQVSASVSSRDIENLMISGDVDLEKLSEADLAGNDYSYTIARSIKSYQRASNNASGEKPILVHADIGNGKTVFSYQLGYLFSQKGFRVFKVQKEPENIGDVLNFFQGFDQPSVVIFDDVMHYLKLPSSIVGLGRKDLIVIATVRTIVIDTASERIRKRLGDVTPIEIDLNIPLRDETQRMVKYLDVNGLWGEDADKSEREKIDFVERTCGGQLRDVVLSLYERGALHVKVEELLVNIQLLDKQSRDLVAICALLNYADFQQSCQFLVVSDLVGYTGILEEFRNNLAEKGLSTLIRLDTVDVLIKSPALAQFIIGRIFNIEYILDLVKKVLVRLDEYYVDDDEFLKMAKALLKFSLYGRWVNGRRDNQAIEKFYDDCRTLSFAASDPLFWVQRSICNMHLKQFDISYRFVDTAYASARKVRNFDTYQIDNHNARLMLTQSRDEGVSSDGARETAALRLIEGVLDRKSNDLYHPLSVMRLFAEIVDKRGNSLSKPQKLSLKSAIDIAVKRIAKVKPGGRFRNLPELKNRLNAASKRLST